MEELITASNMLRYSFNRYLKACSPSTEIYAALGCPNSRSDPRTLKLLDCVAKDLQAINHYEHHIPYLRTTVAQYRNSARSIVPISVLPPEILTRIFELTHWSWMFSTIVKRNSKQRNTGGSTESTPSMPGTVLSRVCSRWRRIALNSPVLWSHIHITTSHLQGPSFRRLVSLASRIGSLDTSLHIDVTPNVTPDILTNVIQLGRFYAGTRKGLQKLQLDNWADKKKFYSVLSLGLTNLVDDTLKQLILVDHPVERGGRTIRIDDAEMRAMDHCVGSVTTLHLINVCLPWSTPAYSGLNDLRLVNSGGNRDFNITIARLKTILSSSPGLRILHFNYGILGSQPPDSTAPVSLEELEELNIHGMSSDDHNPLLQLLFPGPKPLSLTISPNHRRSPGNYEPISTSVLAFTERSNVVELYIQDSIKLETRTLAFPGLPTWRNSPNRPRVLGLGGFRLDETINQRSFRQPGSNRFDLLYLYGCLIHPGVLRELVYAHDVRKLNVCDCKLVEDNGAFAARLESRKRMLAGIVPNVSFIELPEPRRVGEWEYWQVPVPERGITS